jgi:hypothetical protein
VSYLHVQELQPVRDEYLAASAALTYVARVWHELGGEPESRRTRLSHVREADRNLEITYIIRLFSEFEALLSDHLTRRHPGLRVPRSTEALINRVALRERIPDPIRDGVQVVREYRNSIVHRRSGHASVLGFRQAMSSLNQFLALLPDPP